MQHLFNSKGIFFLKNRLDWCGTRDNERNKVTYFEFYENMQASYWCSHSLSLMCTHVLSYFIARLFTSVYLSPAISQSTSYLTHTTLKFLRAPSFNKILA